MTPEDVKPLNAPQDAPEPEDSDEHSDDQSNEEYGPAFLNWKPTTPEDFGPGQEMLRDMFFAFMKEHDEACEAYRAAEEAEQAAEIAKRQSPPPPANP